MGYLCQPVISGGYDHPFSHDHFESCLSKVPGGTVLVPTFINPSHPFPSTCEKDWIQSIYQKLPTIVLAFWARGATIHQLISSLLER